MYLRFVVLERRENPWRATGVFSWAHRVRRDLPVDPEDGEILAFTLDWFEEHLPEPPFDEHFGSKSWTSDAVCWFRPEAREAIAWMWNLVAILKKRTHVRLIRSAKPGQIVYQDDYQIVAETPECAR